MKILLVEDASDQKVLLSAIMKKLGYQFVLARNADEAIELLQEHSDIYIVISGWMMPGMNGPELCQYIRMNCCKTHYIYFIFLTGKSDHKSLVEGINYGADDFLIKPVEVNELQARLNTAKRIIELESSLEKKNNTLKTSLNIMQRDLESAAQIQRDMLVPPMSIGNVSFDWFFQPSQYVSGDMFGYFPIKGDNIFFYQLDVSGHGVRAALFSFMLNNMISRHMSEYASDEISSGFLYNLNNQFSGSIDDSMYFTILCGVINKKTGVVHLSRAGHPLPILIDTQGAKQINVHGGLPLGILNDQEYKSTEVHINKDSKIFIYSDGLLSCKNKDKEFISEANIMNVLSNVSGDSTLIKSKVNEFIHTWHDTEIAFDDDVTYMLIECKSGCEYSE